jgi:hypothetical protein
MKYFLKQFLGLPLFFLQTFQDEVVKRRLPSVPHTRWLYNSRPMKLVSSNKVELQELFISMKGDADEWDK